MLPAIIEFYFKQLKKKQKNKKKLRDCALDLKSLFAIGTKTKRVVIFCVYKPQSVDTCAIRIVPKRNSNQRRPPGPLLARVAGRRL